MNTREDREKVIEDQLSEDLYQTFMAGHNEYRPDLQFPQSKSDVQKGIRAIMRMFKTERRPMV